MHPEIELDRRSKHNLSRQLYEELRRSILSGTVAPNSVLPGTRALAAELSISRATVVSAYNRLKSEGYITGQDGSGTYVSNELPQHPLAEVSASRVEMQSKLQMAKLSAYAKRVLTFQAVDYSWVEPEIAFCGWRGALDAVPVRQISQAFTHVTRKLDPELLDYARDPLGYRPLREAIARWLRKSRGIKCGENQVLVVGGWRQALSLVARIQIERGDLVAMENPSYPAIRQALECEGASIFPVSVDEMGMNVSELLEATHERFNLVYTCPSHQHPTGAVLSLPRRLELLSWAQKSGAVIIEDEHDSEFRFTGAPIPPLKALDENNQVIFLGTFNKSLFPSLSIAYLVLPENLVDVYYRTRDFIGEHVPLLLQAALSEFMQRGLLSRHVRKMHNLYSARRQCLLRALQKHFAARATILGDESGMHVLVRFDTDLQEHELIKKALAAGVGLAGTSSYYVGNPDHPAEYMLGYADLSERKIEEGIRRLSVIITGRVRR